MIRLPDPLACVLVCIGALAVAGIVHVGLVFRTPRHVGNDAWARVNAVATLNGVTALAPEVRVATLPFGDAAMAISVCRYDLTAAPLRVTVEPLDDGFVSLGMHTWHGIAFYGLNLQPQGPAPLTLVVMTAAQNTASDQATDDDGSPLPRALRVVAPEELGFILIETPASSRAGAANVLRHVGCGPMPAA